METISGQSGEQPKSIRFSGSFLRFAWKCPTGQTNSISCTSYSVPGNYRKYTYAYSRNVRGKRLVLVLRPLVSTYSTRCVHIVWSRQRGWRFYHHVSHYVEILYIFIYLQEETPTETQTEVHYNDEKQFTFLSKLLNIQQIQKI